MVIDEIRAAEAVPGTVKVGLDLLGDVASLLEVMLLDAGLKLSTCPGWRSTGLDVGTVGGERKSDPKDPCIIADQVRMRDDLCPVERMRSASSTDPSLSRSASIAPATPATGANEPRARLVTKRSSRWPGAASTSCTRSCAIGVSYEADWKRLVA